ncbi:unnamed protein product, partial [Ixodes hexagonus]
AQGPHPVPAKRQFRSRKRTNDHDTTVYHEDLAVSSRKWSETLDSSRIVHLPFSLSELTGRLFDDNVPLDVVSLKVVDNCDFLQDSDDTSPPYVMKLDPGKDLSAFLVDPNFSEWNHGDDAITLEDVSRRASDAGAGLDCVSPDLVPSSAGPPGSETWVGSPLDEGLQQRQDLKDLPAASPPVSEMGAFEEHASLTVQPADKAALSGEIPALHPTSCSSYQDILQADGGSVVAAQTSSDCCGIFAEAVNKDKRAVPAVSPPQQDAEDMAPKQIDGNNYKNIIENATTTDLKRGFLGTFCSRDIASASEGKESHGKPRPSLMDMLLRFSNAICVGTLIQYSEYYELGRKKNARARERIKPLSGQVNWANLTSEPSGSTAASLVPLGHLNKECLEDLLGREKGIQGHHNSCYLDATLFAMFSCTDVFDGMINRPKSKTHDIDAYDDIQAVLRDDIVNTLRRDKFVPHKNVMKLRELLDALGGVSGLTTEEKDPEEFLNSLFTALRVEPYLKLSSGQGTHLYQLFVEKHELLDIPTVQQLFHHSIHDSNIKLNEASDIPSALIIQMPRFGKQFKVYPHIVPSLKLDVTDALENSPRSCFVCGRLACEECRDCFRPDIGLEGTSYCSSCSDAVHKHPDRLKHTRNKLKVVDGIPKDQPVQRHYMDLCAIVCIETSHYVCFVKYGDGDGSTWVFFDSMADREGGEDGHNIPEVTQFLDYKWWLGDASVTKVRESPDPKFLPNMARRLVCDAYMCMYRSDMASRYN